MIRETSRAKVLRRLRIGAAIAVAAAVGFVAWLVLTDRDDRSDAATMDPVATSPKALADLGSSAGHPIYWAGARAGYTYELTRTPDGRVYLRYLPPGVELGDPRANYLVVSTYRERGAFAALQAAGKRPGVRARRVTGGGVVVYNPRRPRNVYFSFPEANYQVEVYHSSARRARELVLSGAVRPVR